MTQARQLRQANGEPLMDSDPHPIVGWARFLEWQSSASGGLTPKQSQRLKLSVAKAEVVYRHWRPELRYKSTDVDEKQVSQVAQATRWFLQQRGRL
jgi:hypothetical protein